MNKKKRKKKKRKKKKERKKEEKNRKSKMYPIRSTGILRSVCIRAGVNLI